MRILLLGGTADATLLAQRLANSGLDAVFSYAGRTSAPTAQPLPTRNGGFGGVAGLADFLGTEAITHVVDATHPFAAGMSRNAVAACALRGVSLIALERAPWSSGDRDRWTCVPSIEAAVAALPDTPARVFLAIGRQSLDAFAAKPQHFYLLRYIEAPETIPLPDHVGIAGRGPFTAEGDFALMRQHRIGIVVAKNAGGNAARAKLIAARQLGLPVMMIERPAIPPRRCCKTADEVMAWLAHEADRGV